MITHDQIVAECKDVLESAGKHETITINQDRFMTAYQVWAELKNRQHPICDELIAECGDEYVGKGAGSNVGPAQKIAQALGRHSEIETRYIDTKNINFGDVEPSGTDCGIFRIKI